MLKIDLRKTDFHPNGDLGHDTRQIEVKDSFDFDELPNLLFDFFFNEIKSWLDCSQIYMFARAQFTPDKYDYVTCNLYSMPEIARQEVEDFFCHICRFFEGKKRQVVQTIWQAYDGAANVVMNFYYKAD